MTVSARLAAARLSRSTPSDVAEARSHLVRLVAAARDLDRQITHIPVEGPFDQADPCPGDGCPLGGVRTGALLCALTRRLATLDVVAPALDPIDEPIGRLVIALLDSMDAVRTCRQTLHPSGMCWFAGVDGVDGCGEVLHVAHLLDR